MIAIMRMVSGLVLWAAGFSILYALHGLGCALGWTGPSIFGLTQVKGLLIAAWLCLVAAQAGLIVWLLRYRESQMDRIGIANGWIGFFATVVGGFPVLAISSCL